jgi:hypothetical protein
MTTNSYAVTASTKCMHTLHTCHMHKLTSNGYNYNK